jgi:4-amino-4-deoxy-L-arabinose transferase-like glycosyltransferase
VPAVRTVSSSSATAAGVTNAHVGRWAHLLLALVSVLVALIYVGLVPAGQPYDEPAHWSNVQYYAHQERMPELGKLGVSYEAQMGPIYYALAAAIARPTEALFNEEAAFYAVRVAGVFLVGAAVLLTFALSISLMPGRRGVALAAAAFMGLNPSLLAVAASVQNDYLAMVLALLAALIAVRAFQASPSSWRPWLVVGIVAGLATLTKVFAIGLLVALAAAVLTVSSRERRNRLRGCAVAGLSFVVVSGWWFVRNAVLYGDLTGRAGLKSAGWRFPPLAYTGPSSIGTWIRSLVSYLWVPTEYYRNAFSAPGVLRALAVAATAVIAVATVIGIRRLLSSRSRPKHMTAALFVAGFFGITFVTYAVMTWTWTDLAPRIAFVALPGAVVLVCASDAAAVRSPRLRATAALAVIGFMLLISIFVLWKVSAIGPAPFQIQF